MFVFRAVRGKWERKWSNRRENSSAIKERKLISPSSLTECSLGCCFHRCRGRLLMIMRSACLSFIEVFARAGKKKKRDNFCQILLRSWQPSTSCCAMRVSVGALAMNSSEKAHHYLLWHSRSIWDWGNSLRKANKLNVVVSRSWFTRWKRREYRLNVCWK